MTADIEAPLVEDGRILLERGRYALTALPDGSWVITRAAPICDTCQNCGCGEQADPIQVPAMIVNLMTMDPDKRAKLNPLSMMRKLISSGTD